MPETDYRRYGDIDRRWKVDGGRRINISICRMVIIILTTSILAFSCESKKMTEMEYNRYLGVAVSKAKIYKSLPAGKGLDYKPSAGFAYLVCRTVIKNKSSHSIHVEPEYFSIHTEDERIFLCNEEVSSAQNDFLGTMDLHAGENIEGILVFDIQKASYYELVFKTFNREIHKRLEVEGEI